MSKYQSISVMDAMNNIATHKYLLPAIQRKFVWSMEQIEMLFDSILRNYPINSFMLWKITNQEDKTGYKFYEFLQNYVQKFGEDNPDASTQFLKNDFYAVIDGQQRLTSLFIGLGGSYKVKRPNKWWGDNENKTSMVERRLYLELTSDLKSSIDNDKLYNFQFLSDEELENEKTKNPERHWFLLKQLSDFKDLSFVYRYLKDSDLFDNEFAATTLPKLYEKLNSQQIINYYEIDDQDQDKVLEVFIRTNSGGTPLSFSDLLMSIASANWDEFDARSEISQAKEIIYSYGNPNFNVSQDFILKALLVLSDVDVKFKINNFRKDNIEVFEKNWPEIKKSLESTFRLLEELNFNDSMLKAKNAAIPIAYYIYKNKLADEIVKTTYDKEDKKRIARWLSMSLLKGTFGGSSDSVLKTLRDILSNPCKEFPLEKIIEEFNKNPDRNYIFTDEILLALLEEQYGTPNCSIVLNLLYPEVVLEYGKSIAQDHMHPKTFFENQQKLADILPSVDKKDFYTNKANYNSCLNLQLLESIQNGSKLETPLSEWARANNKKNSDLYLDDDISLDVKCFEDFISNRKKNLLAKLKEILE